MKIISKFHGKREERERERERGKRDNFCVINVKYKEISWRVRRRRRGEEEKSNF